VIEAKGTAAEFDERRGGILIVVTGAEVAVVDPTVLEGTVPDIGVAAELEVGEVVLAAA
jgi:hypothetical protein